LIMQSYMDGRHYLLKIKKKRPPKITRSFKVT